MRCEPSQNEPPIPFAKLFHTLCDGKKTLLVAKGENGKIFGAYTDIVWQSNVAVRKC